MKKVRINNPNIYIFDENGNFVEKRCPHCGQFKSVSLFQRSKSRPNNIHPYCKECRKLENINNKKHIQRTNSERLSRYRLTAHQIISGKNIPSCEASNIWGCCQDTTNGLFLSIDHIYNDGFSDKKDKKLHSTQSLYRWVINNPQMARERLQILCMNAQTFKKKVGQVINFKNGYGTVTHERKTCHGCKGKGYIIVDQMTDDKLNENKHE